jgi:hypothetical protein
VPVGFRVRLLSHPKVRLGGHSASAPESLAFFRVPPSRNAAPQRGAPMPETVVHFQIRMPPALHEQLASWAKEDKASLNALIVGLLEKAIEQHEKSVSKHPSATN